ncbi:MAG: hypothetical protein CFE23_04245 [Flavobacterium sp. BFFFF1]|uniref:DUF6526 family protein n=1 Tax=Flavobacterium sp. BFFFF1 TaxID=2015557 RepID=UPI000BD796E9|nr:DUF6526 family protein [Flavobacterium sp. BFFFF1]OYU81686.1 MAG: hypothetical protein CFE23_04245 [Flavobacterium sp. BFFFF1]
MAEQSYKNHLRFYPPHHFVFYPVLTGLLGFSLYYLFTSTDKISWVFITILIVLMGWLSFMMRQHYALTLQDRIIRLELRYRYFTVTGKRLDDVEEKFTDSQLFALRFCMDSDLPAIVEKAIAENLSAKQIKAQIKNWNADNCRV